MKLLSFTILLIVVELSSTAHLNAVTSSYEEDVIRLAESGDPQAQFSLALLYEYGGETVKRDPLKSLVLLEQAGQKGIAAACLYLGLKYEYGNKVKKDLQQAACWYKCAAYKDWPAAQFFLAHL